MNKKLALWKKLAALIAVIVAALLGSGSSKALSVDNKHPSKLTIEKRLAKVRKLIKIKAGENEHKSSTFPFSYSELVSQQISRGRGRNKPESNNLPESNKGWEKWRDWSNGWRDWSDGWRDWSDGWRDWSDGWRDWDNKPPEPQLPDPKPPDQQPPDRQQN